MVFEVLAGHDLQASQFIPPSDLGWKSTNYDFVKILSSRTSSPVLTRRRLINLIG